MVTHSQVARLQPRHRPKDSASTQTNPGARRVSALVLVAAAVKRTQDPRPTQVSVSSSVRGQEAPPLSPLATLLFVLAEPHLAASLTYSALAEPHLAVPPGASSQKKQRIYSFADYGPPASLFFRGRFERRHKHPPDQRRLGRLPCSLRECPHPPHPSTRPRTGARDGVKEGRWATRRQMTR